MSDLQQLADWAGPLLRRLDPKARRALARELAQDLRRRQRERIRAQRNPDGTPFAPRAERLRDRRGAIRRRAMFSRLPMNRWLRARAQGDTAEVGFFGRVAQLAWVHQYGLRDRVARDGPRVQYPRREVLGFSAEDLARVRNLLIDRLIR